MKKLLIIILLLVGAHVLVAQEQELNYDQIPENLLGIWVIEMTGENEAPCQIFRWQFSENQKDQGVCEFHWLYKKPTDTDFITVGIFVFDFKVKDNKIYTQLTKTGSQQVISTGLTLRETIVWHYPGDEEFDEYGRKDVVLEFELMDTYLILLEDTNGDGDFDDEGETQKYSRIEDYKSIQI